MKFTVTVMALGAMFGLACTNLPTIEETGCGNRVVNVDEDCDGVSPFGDGTGCGAPNTANACHLICGGAESLVCPPGWGCGGDNQCRAPGGEFSRAPGSPWRFKVDDFAIGDVDGDAKNDLIGSDYTALTIRYGSDNGEFPTETSLLTPQPSGRPTFAKLSGDARVDAVLPVVSGVFSLLGRAERALDPVPYAPFDIPQEGNIRVIAIDAQPDFDWEILIMTNEGMAFEESGFSMGTALPAGNLVTNLVGRPPVAYLDKDTTDPFSDDPRAEFALAFSGANRVFVYEAVGVGPTLRVSERQFVTVPGSVQNGARFADVDGNGFADLLISYREPGGESRVAVSYNTNGSLQVIAAPLVALDRMSGNPWPLAAADLNGDGRADYVYNDAIVLATGGAVPGPPSAVFGTAFAVNDNWAEATIADVNGDGLPDPAMIIEGADGIELFLNTGVGVFNKFNVDTESPPVAIRSGDFDGDLIGDIALVEGGFGAKPDRVSVVFGAREGGPSAPVNMGSLGLIEAFEPMYVNNVVEGLDLVTDLLVVASTEESRALALLAGTTSRRMLAPFTLQESGDERVDVPVATLVGPFGLTDDASTDIVAIAQRAAEFFGMTPSVAGALPRIWLLEGIGAEGNLNSASAAVEDMPDEDEFDAGCAHFTSGELDAKGTTPQRHEVIGVDISDDCFGGFATPASRLFVARLEPGSGFVSEVMDLQDTLVAPTSIALHNVDGDDDLDAVVVFRGEFKGITGTGAKAGVAVMWNEDGALAPERMSVATLPPGVGVFGAAPIQTDDDPELELVILGSDGVYLADLDLESLGWSTPALVFRADTDGRLAVGDLNADGLMDVAFTVGNNVEIALQRAAAPLGAAQLVDFVEPMPGEGQ